MKRILFASYMPFNMKYDVVVITGASNADTSTIANSLSERNNKFQIVPILTTCNTLSNTNEEHCLIDRQELQTLEKNNELLVKTEYEGVLPG